MTNKHQPIPDTISESEFEKIWLGDYIKNSLYDKYYQLDHEGNLKRVIFENITINDGIFIYDNYDDFFPDILIYNCSISSFHIENIKTGDITILNSEIEQIDLEKSSCGVLKLKELKGLDEISLFSMTFSKVNFEDFDIKKKVRLIYSGMSELTLINFGRKMYVDIDDGCGISKLIVVTNSTIRLDIENAQIGELIFTNGVITRDSFIKISNSRINLVVFDSLTNLGNISFKGVKPIESYKKWAEDRNGNDIYRDKEHNPSVRIVERESEIHFLHSDLGKFSMIECELDKFKKFIFFNTKMLEIFVAGTHLPTYITVPKQYESEHLEQQRLGFSQFKKIFENRGDIIIASIYHVRDLDIYRQQLKQRKEKLSIYSRAWRSDFSELFNLSLNRLSNNYGHSWLRGAVVTLGATFLFFTLYCFLLGNSFGSSFERFFTLFSYSFEFINPLRKSKELEDVVRMTKNEYLLSAARILDYMSRIFLAYFAYQTIQAFRKYGKKT